LKEAVADATFKTGRKKSPERILALPDLEHAKTAGLNSLTSASGQRTYEHAIREFVGWYCSAPRLPFNRTVVLRYRIHLEQRNYAPPTINLRLAAVRRAAYEAAGRQGWTCANRPDPNVGEDCRGAVADITHGPVFRAINKAGRVWGDGMSPKVLWDVGTGPDPVSLGARVDSDHRALSGMSG
jgi:hypothetical protein